MYVATFYSFKGGVGRSMALMNVAAQLLLRGKRVLVVDFDLEAPGLPTFKMARSDSDNKGVVEYISQFLASHETPDVRDFVYECPTISEGAGRLFVMPAGIQDSTYPRRLGAIDWNNLYAEHDGYLFFEDMKLQWKESLNPDYVLIDSRTGHSDVVGICTRQLPDEVVFLFFPNEQNIHGIRGVADHIKRQNEQGAFEAINVIFVPSNVPLEDDESGSRETMLRQCAIELGLKDFPATLHHYESPALMHQEIFSLSRERHPLVSEYKELVEKIIERNVNDRDVALAKLKSSFKSILEEVEFSQQDDRWSLCSDIARRWADDGEICFWYSRISRALGSREESLENIDRSIELGYRTFASLFERAVLLKALGRNDEAVCALKEISSEESLGVTAFDVIRMLRMALQTNAELALELVSTNKIKALSVSEVVLVASEIDGSDGSAVVVEVLIRNALSTLSKESEYLDRVNLNHCLAIALIAQGKLEEAAKLLSEDLSHNRLELASCFNLAFSLYWIGRKEEAIKWAGVFLQLANDAERPKDANFFQCIAFANWLVGDVVSAHDAIGEARNVVARDPRRSFSAWAYQRVSSKSFIRQLDDMERLFCGEHVEPDFIKR